MFSTIQLTGKKVYCLAPRIVLEGFEDGGLALRLTDRRLFELNRIAYFILEHTDGRRDVTQIAGILAAAFDIAREEAIRETITFYEQLSGQQLVQLVDSGQSSKENYVVVDTMVKSPKYMQNPDVVLREEDEDGGLLFNPDTSQVKVVNATGLFIWQQCNGNYDLSDIVNALLEEFEGASQEEITQDVQEFVEKMTTSGFIGTVETLDAEG